MVSRAGGGNQSHLCRVFHGWVPDVNRKKCLPFEALHERDFFTPEKLHCRPGNLASPKNRLLDKKTFTPPCHPHVLASARIGK